VKRLLILLLLSCSPSTPLDTCNPACNVALDGSWSQVHPGVWEHSTKGAVPGLVVGAVCTATLDGRVLDVSWLVEDTGSWTRDFAEREEPQSYTVSTNARIGVVSTSVCR